MTVKKCRVCGKGYEVCKNNLRNPNQTFRWQEVACSPECGNVYFERILASRSKASVTEQKDIIEEDIFVDIFEDFDEDEEEFDEEEF